MSKTHCPLGHQYPTDEIRRTDSGARWCQKCEYLTLQGAMERMDRYTKAPAWGQLKEDATIILTALRRLLPTPHQEPDR